MVNRSISFGVWAKLVTRVFSGASRTQKGEWGEGRRCSPGVQRTRLAGCQFDNGRISYRHLLHGIIESNALLANSNGTGMELEVADIDVAR